MAGHGQEKCILETNKPHELPARATAAAALRINGVETAARVNAGDIVDSGEPRKAERHGHGNKPRKTAEHGGHK
jgi:hypothetical protein